MAKGDYNDLCNRTVCTNGNAQYYNTSTRKHYCGTCAHNINAINMMELCVLVETDNEGNPIEVSKDIIESNNTKGSFATGSFMGEFKAFQTKSNRK